MIERLESLIIQFCIRKSLERIHGPVGETPVHLAFLFGEHKLGQRIIES